MKIDTEYFLSQASNCPVWRANQGHGSAIAFDMGNKIFGKNLDGKTYSKGEIKLRVFCCEWYIKKNHETICHSESTAAEIATNLQVFVGAILKKISKISETELNLCFSVDPILILHNNSGFYEEDDNFFTMFVKGYSLSYNQKNGFIIQRSAR